MRTRYPLLGILTLLSLFVASSALAASSASWDGRAWRVGHHDDNGAVAIIEWVLEGETVESWTELVTLQLLDSYAAPSKHVTQLQEIMEHRCPSVIWTVLEENRRSILYEWRISGCAPHPDQHELSRFLRADDGNYRIGYVAKVVQLSPDTRSRWIELLSQLQVSDLRDLRKGSGTVVTATPPPETSAGGPPQNSPGDGAVSEYAQGLAAYETGDYERALAILRPLAERGDAKAQLDLGWMYDNGEGLAENDAKAVEWYRKAAEQGDADAQFNLGCIYENWKVKAEAYVWFDIAAAQGLEPARVARNEMATRMTPMQLSEAKRRATEIHETFVSSKRKEASPWPVTASEQSPEEAYNELQERNIPWGEDEFINRARQGDTGAVELFITAGMDPNVKDKDGRTALMWAAEFGYTDSIEALIDGGADVHARNLRESTSLMFAAKEGHSATLRVLLDRGADVRARNNSGLTALMGAARNGHAATLNILLDSGADVDATRNGVTALMTAAMYGPPDVVRALLEGGANVSVTTEDGKTALMFAATGGPADAVRLLLDRGAEVNASNADGGTALIVAASNGSSSIVRLLLESGAQVNLRDKDGYTALMLARANGYPTIVRALLAAGGF